MEIINDNIKKKLCLKLLGSLMEFTQFFYKLRTKKEFFISQPVGRESHFITVFRELTNIFYLKKNRLLINIPPGYGKSEMLIHFVAWAMAHYPDSNFLYIAYSSELATKHTYTIKQIISMPEFKELFGVEIKRDSSAKDNFKTNFGGSVCAFGSSGSITGQDGGLPNLDRFSGAIIMDDMHKPMEVHSDSMRQGVIKTYNETIKLRQRGMNVPFIFIGQRLHEDDLPAFFIDKKDGYEWKTVIIKALDENKNALYPTKDSLEKLLIEQRINPYTFSSQYQQNPMPSGGALFKKENFVILDDEPEILGTFITCDTAETAKTYNDATVFSFFGYYKIRLHGVDSGLIGLHWLDCREMWVEPFELHKAFLDFFVDCMRYGIKPKYSAIEKKSTGTTLISVLKQFQGLNIIEVDRNVSSGSKIDRFLACQNFIASKCISFPKYGKHNDMCMEHMNKITANNTHARDDICDTVEMAIKLTLIDKTIINIVSHDDDNNDVINEVLNQINNLNKERKNIWNP